MSALAVTVSGSFRKAMSEIQAAVEQLWALGAIVLSPADPRVVDSFGEFLFVASDRLRTIRTVQKRHHAAIRESDFVWLVAPDGYIGTSAAIEIGVADTAGVPVYTDNVPNDWTARQLVHTVVDIKSALEHVTNPSVPGPDVLLDPAWAADTAHRHLDVIQTELTHPRDFYSDARLRASTGEIRRILRNV